MKKVYKDDCEAYYVYDFDNGKIIYNELLNLLKDDLDETKKSWWNPKESNLEIEGSDGEIYLKDGTTIIIQASLCYDYYENIEDYFFQVCLPKQTDITDKYSKDFDDIIYKHYLWEIILGSHI